MRQKQNVLKYLSITLFLLISTSILAQKKVIIDNSIILDTTIVDKNYEISESEHINNDKENIMFYSLNYQNNLHFFILSAVSIKDIKNPYNTFSFSEFFTFCEDKFKETATKNTMWQINPKAYLSNFQFNNLYIKVLNNKTKEVIYYKVHLKHSIAGERLMKQD